MNKLVLLFLTMVMSFFSHLSAVYQMEEGNLIEKVLIHENYCVRCIQEDKIFLQPDKILITDKGIFLDVNGLEYYRLSQLQANEHGCYIQVSFFPTHSMTELSKKKPKSKGECPNCFLPTDSEGRCINLVCAFCGYRVI